MGSLNPVFGPSFRGRSLSPLANRLSFRALLAIGCSGLFLVWAGSSYILMRRMVEADSQASAIRSRFLQNEQHLSTVRTQTLLSSLYLRDALLEATPIGAAPYQDRLSAMREETEHALVGYTPRVASTDEREQWVRLQNELREFWDSMLPGLTLEESLNAAADALLTEMIPRSDTILRLSDRIHGLNQTAFDAEQTELATLRDGLRRRVWETATAALVLGLGLAFVAFRRAGRLESSVREQQAHQLQHSDELERLSSELIQAQEDDRRRIARDLHDEIGQALSAVKLELLMAERSIGMAANATAFSEARAITDGALQTVRNLSQLLHPSMLDDLGLRDTTHWYLNGFSRRTGITSELVVEPRDARMAREVELCTYRVIQEAVTNIGRHAQATSCRVHIEQLPLRLHVTIEDDGKGFDTAVLRGASERGLGLVSVRERVARLGGSLRVDSHVGSGTRLEVELPMAAVTSS